MRRFLCFVVIVCGVLSVSATGWTATDPARAWEQAKTFLKQGAYRDALESFDVILAATPNDPWAQLYHSLCELRLQSTQPFVELSPEQLGALKRRLRDEERQQRRSAAQQKAFERQIRKEQAKWDQELTALQRQADQEEKRQRQQAQVEAMKRIRAERAQRREAALQHAVQQAQPEAVSPPSGEPTHPQPQPPSKPKASESTPSEEAPTLSSEQPQTTSEPATVEPSPPSQQHPPAPETSATVPTVSGPSVELSPVVVPTTAKEATTKEQGAPSLKTRTPLPPGAVQINARQMTVSPDRKIAIADGDVEVLYENAFLTCDHLTLFTDTKDVYAEGRVRLEQGDQVFRGEMVHYNFDTKKGRFLQGTVSSFPWTEHGRSVEHLAEGVYEVTPGYITSCDLEPPHFKFYGSRAIVFSEDKMARAKNVTFFVDKVPFIFLPWITVEDKQPPFFIIPGKKKPWGQFALMGYRYQLPPLPGGGKQSGTIKLDWRRFFGWGVGLDHKIDSPVWGSGLFKGYYNEEQNMSKKKEEIPKGGQGNRFRLLWRHRWNPLPDTTIITDYQKYSDIDYRRELLYREEFTKDDLPESFISSVTTTPAYTFSALLKKRVNRFQTVDNVLPQLTFEVPQRPIGDSQLFSQSKFDLANFQTKVANTHNKPQVFRLDWFQQLSYAMNLFRPIEVTPKAGIRQTFYSHDIQGNSPQGKSDRFSGQFSAGLDSSLKLFRVFPVVTNALGLNIHWLRHVLTPTVSYTYDHPATVPNAELLFPTAPAPISQMVLGLENKLQTRRPGKSGKLQSVDLGRFLVSVPYTYRGDGNKQGGRINDWSYRAEIYPWPWMRLESDWTYRTHLSDTAVQNDSHYSTWNTDLVVVGGQHQPRAQYAPDIQTPTYRALEVGRQGGINFIPQGQWYLGLGHRYSQNDKTESVVELDWRLSEKWQIGTFQRLTWKEVVGMEKRFFNRREQQYSLRRDLHDWVGEVVYHVDREFGEELYFTVTLKAYPALPIATSDSYHQPKAGSQSSPFSPIRVQDLPKG